MTVAIVCLLIAGLMFLLPTAVAKWGFKNYDNHNPRQWMSQQEGYRARANAAQQNCFEAFPFFAAALLLALHMKVDAWRIDVYAVVFVAARLAYVYCYVSDRAALRSVVWLIGILCPIGLFSAALGY